MNAVQTTIEVLVLGALGIAFVMGLVAALKGKKGHDAGGAQKSKALRFGAWTPFLLFALGLMGLMFLLVGLRRHALGDNSLTGRRHPTGWYQEIAIGALLIVLSVSAYFSSGGIGKDNDG